MSNNDQICFVRRNSDGKFLRGSSFFPWVRSWRRAACLPVGTVEQWMSVGWLSQFGINSHYDVTIVTTAEVLDEKFDKQAAIDTRIDKLHE